MIRADSVPEPPSDDENSEAISEKVDPHGEFWSQTEQLAHIRDFARSRRAAPAATLGGVLRRAAACIEPHVVLPPLVGGYASVSLFSASAGVSGQGKGAGDAAGTGAVYFHDHLANSLDAVRPSIGSGEGLARLFSGGKGQEPLTRAHLIVPEVKTLEALVGRQGSTLDGELLKAFMGEAMGFHNAQRETTTAVAAHSYRLCLGVGVQPENAGFFLSREKDGFPQRFLWLPTIDMFAPPECPNPVDPLHVLVPTFEPNQDDGFHVLEIPDSVRAEVDAHRHRVLIGDPNVNPLDGHLMLTRLKVAFALAVLHGKATLDESDWKIAGDLIVMSTSVREQLRETVAAAHRRQNAAKGYDQAAREEIVSDKLAKTARDRVVKAICGKLRRCGRATKRDLYGACAGAIRSEFDGVFDLMCDQAVIVPCGEPSNAFAKQFEFGAEYGGVEL